MSRLPGENLKKKLVIVIALGQKTRHLKNITATSFILGQLIEDNEQTACEN